MNDVKVERIFARKGLKDVNISKDEIEERLNEGWEIGVELSINGKFCGLYVSKDGVEFVPWGGVELRDYFERNKNKILRAVFGSKIKSIVC